MDTKQPSIGDTVSVWDHKFKWTDKHYTPAQLWPLRQQGDELGRAGLERLQAIVAKEKGENAGPPCRVDMYSVLEKHHAEDPILQELWEETTTVPEWVDWEQIERGQLFFYRYLLANATGLALHGFLGGAATIAGGAEVLAKTGGFSTRALPRRFMETFQWLIQATMSLDSIKPGGDGHKSTVRVRLLHATVRGRVMKLIEKDPSYFDEAKYGTPVNYVEKMHAICIFCCMPMFRQLPTIGINPQPDELEDFLALFRYITYLLATPESYFDSVEQARATMESVMFSEPELTGASRAIADNFVTAVSDYPGVNVSRPLIEMGCRIMSGDRLADRMGFPRPGIIYWAMFRGFCNLLVAVATVQKIIPSLEQTMIEKSKDFLRVNIIGSAMLKGGTKFELKWIPALKKMTGSEPKESTEGQS